MYLLENNKNEQNNANISKSNSNLYKNNNLFL